MVALSVASPVAVDSHNSHYRDDQAVPSFHTKLKLDPPNCMHGAIAQLQRRTTFLSTACFEVGDPTLVSSTHMHGETTTWITFLEAAKQHLDRTWSKLQSRRRPGA